MCIHIDKTCKNATINKTSANILMKSRKAGSELRKSLSIFINAIYFSIIAVPEKSNFLFLWYKTLCQTQKNTYEFLLYCWNHVCNVNEWFLVCCINCELRVCTQKMVHDYCNKKCKTIAACGRLLMALYVISSLQFKIFTLIQTLKSLLEFKNALRISFSFKI